MNISKTIISRIVNEMLHNAQDMGDVVVIPNSYTVYIHTEDYKDIKHFLDILREEIIKSLDKEIKKRSKSNSNEGANLRNILNKFIGFDAFSKNKQYRRVSDDWHISFQESAGKVLFHDQVFELKQGEVGIVRSFSANSKPNLNSQYETLVTIYKKDDSVSKTLIESGDISELPTLPKTMSEPYLACIEYRYKGLDGVYTYHMRKNKIVIGRQKSEEVDLSLSNASDRISRKHIEITAKKDSGKFFLKSMGTFGTTLNGVKVPDSPKTFIDNSANINNEVELLHSSRISLAGGEVFLDFYIKT